MRVKEKPMGRFSVEFEIANNEDLVRAKNGDIRNDQVRRKIIQGVVDPGATRLVLPLEVTKELGLPVKNKKVKVRYADNRPGMRAEVGQVHLFLLGREDVFSAIVEPKRDTALIGAIVLEDLDFLVDCTKQRLVPRDPDHIFSEIE
jgi:predicted aspartyl protease